MAEPFRSNTNDASYDPRRAALRGMDFVDRPEEGAERLEAQIVAAIPRLRAMALSLCGDLDRADDLVQEALARALKALSSFTEGTNLLGWLFTILRNFYYNEFHKRRREVDDPEGRFAATLVAEPSQEYHVHFLHLTRALRRLPAEQREALELVAVGGFSYDEVAIICDCPIGTVRSRVNRARGELARLTRSREDERAHA